MKGRSWRPKSFRQLFTSLQQITRGILPHSYPPFPARQGLPPPDGRETREGYFGHDYLLSIIYSAVYSTWEINETAAAPEEGDCLLTRERKPRSGISGNKDDPVGSSDSQPGEFSCPIIFSSSSRAAVRGIEEAICNTK